MSVKWTPGEESSKDKCQNCGNPVTPDFRRVFGDNNDIAHACVDCSTRGEIMEGDAA